MSKTYERNTPESKFYSSVIIGSKGYNPTITNYFATVSGGGDVLVRVEEVFNGVLFSQTISGSDYPKQWPAYDYSITYDAWESTTYSG